MEEAELRGWIEKLQARLQATGLESPQQLQTVLESVVVKKQSLCETLQSWNNRSVPPPHMYVNIYNLYWMCFQLL